MSLRKFFSRYPAITKSFEKMIEVGKRLGEYEYDTQLDLISSILMLMGRQIGGLSYFYKADEYDFIMNGWADGLRDFHPKSIFEAVEMVLDGKYQKRDDIVPRNPMEFKNFMRNCPSNEIPPYYAPAPIDALRIGYDSEEARERSRIKAEENLKEIRRQIKSSYVKVTRACNQKGENHG